MASITIRNLEPAVKEELRAQAARHRQSMAAEARALLRAGLGMQPNLVDIIRRRFAGLGGVDLNLPPREPMREPPNFDAPAFSSRRKRRGKQAP
jgi:antitoxin FitA